MAEQPAAPERPLVLTVLAGGGFTFETKVLLQSLRETVCFTYLRTHFGGAPGEDGIPPGPDRVVPMFATVTERSVWQSVRAFVATFQATRAVLRDRRVGAIMGVGCSHLVPMFLAGRIAGRQNIYIETITRSTQLSMTGKLVYHLRLADVFFVQWPELKAQYPRCREGTIL